MAAPRIPVTSVTKSPRFRCHESEKVRPIGTTMMDCGARSVLFNDASDVFTGTFTGAGGFKVITLNLVVAPKLGVDIGLTYQLTTEEARMLAASLIRIADRHEAEAATQAADAIAAARRGGR